MQLSRLAFRGPVVDEFILQTYKPLAYFTTPKLGLSFIVRNVLMNG